MLVEIYYFGIIQLQLFSIMPIRHSAKPSQNNPMPSALMLVACLGGCGNWESCFSWLEPRFLLTMPLRWIQIIKELMSFQNQCVISLSKLTLPESVRPKRLTLSVATSSEELFIQTYKNVKSNKINFYRESLFLCSLPHQLCFLVYQVDDCGQHLLLKQLTVEPTELRTITLRPSGFKTTHGGFQLDWQSWIFTEDSEDLNELTDRDYSQLDLPFQNHELPTQSREIRDYHSPNHHEPYHQNMKRRSSSTDGSSTHDLKQQSGFEPMDTRKPSLLDSKAKSPSKQRTKMKSHLYSGLVKMASELFSQSSS